MKSSTCMESAEVYAASISVKAGALTRGSLAVSRRSIGPRSYGTGGKPAGKRRRQRSAYVGSSDREHREVRLRRQKSAEGIVGRLDAAEGPNTQWWDGA